MFAPLSLARSSTTASPISLTTHAAGASAGHTVSFRVDAGDPELYRASITYAGFRVLGFLTVGPAGSAVGSFELDFTGDGTADRTLPLTSLSSTKAYVDILPDGAFSPALEPVVTIAGDTLDLRLPAGGDANVDTRVAPFGCTVRLTLLPQVIVNPTLGGDYPIVVRVTSVDPDTDGVDDGFGSPPVTSSTSFPLRIDGPVLTRFAALRVEDLDVKHNGRNHDRVTVDGRFVLGATSDGINRRTDDVTVSFASFSQTIPARAFVSDGWSREYRDRGRGPGVERMTINARGDFDIDIRGINLIISTRQQTFLLQIGNDVGSVVVPVPFRSGHDDRDRR